MVRAVRRIHNQKIVDTIPEHKAHSLKYYPAYHSGQKQAYVNDSDQAKALARCRLGDIDLGQRDIIPIVHCPCCAVGPNNLMHLLFDCKLIKK